MNDASVATISHGPDDNRRDAYRAPAVQPVHVSVRPTLEVAARRHAGGGGRTVPVSADMHDISALGIAVVLTLEADALLDTDELLLEFELPGDGQWVQLPARVRYRELNGDSVRYGCAWMAERAEQRRNLDTVMEYVMGCQRRSLRQRRVAKAK